jgi:hypothetical protein
LAKYDRTLGYFGISGFKIFQGFGETQIVDGSGTIQLETTFRSIQSLGEEKPFVSR